MDNDLMALLRFHLRETDAEGCCGCGGFTNEELALLLDKHDGDVNAASYEGLLLKARRDAVTLPDGLSLPDGSNYWLALARLYRPCAGGNLPRADEVI